MDSTDVMTYGNEMLKPKPFADTQIMLTKNAPEILVVAGVVGVVVSTVLACRATLKAEETLERAKEKFANIAELRELSFREEVKSGAVEIDYTDADYRQDMVVASTQTAVEFFKLYGLPAILMAGSIFCIFKGHNITVKRNAGLTAAVSALSAGYKAYRDRVREAFGEDAEQRVYYDIKDETKEIVDAKGKTVKKKVSTVTLSEDVSTYARYFDESSREYQPSPELNLSFLRCKQNYLNDRLRVNKVVFLNEVYDELGLERSQAGQVVGWAVTPDGDNYIDFGMYKGDTAQKRAFINGDERSVLLDFNVDGMVWDQV